MATNSILNPHSNLLRAGKFTTGSGLNGQSQPQSVGQPIVKNKLANQKPRRPVRN